MNKLKVILKFCSEDYTTDNFTLLFNQFEIIKTDKQYEKYKEDIKEVIHVIVDYLLYGENKAYEIFDLFCEYDILKELVFLSKESNCRDINLEIINDIAMLVLNLKHNESLYYLFSNNYINQIISNQYSTYDDDFISYYVNFLKSLSLKLDITTIQFFFHKQINSFPLIEAAMRIYNHSDPMVRNVVRNIFLTITKLHYQPFIDYLCNLPSVSYFPFIACHLRDLTIRIEKTDSVDKSKLMQEDLIDDIIYIQDIFSLRVSKINYILTNTLMYYYIMPLLLGTLQSESSTQISISLALYMLIVLFYYIKDENFLNGLFLVVFSPLLSKGMIRLMKEYPIDPKYYYYDYKEEKKQSSDSYSCFIEKHFSAPFILSIVNMKNSPYDKIREIVKKYEDLQDLNPDYNQQNANFLKTITMNVLDRITTSEFSIITAYHKRLSIATGVNCGLSTKDWKDCFMNKMTSIIERVTSNKTKKLVPNSIKETLYSFLKTKEDSLLLLVNLQLNVVLHQSNISKELLSHTRLYNGLIDNKENEESSIKKTYTNTGYSNSNTKQLLNNDNDSELINDSNDNDSNQDKDKDQTKSCLSSTIVVKKKKSNRNKISLTDFINNSKEGETNMFTNDYLSTRFTIIDFDYDFKIVDSLLKLISTELCFRKITIRLIIENTSLIAKGFLYAEHRSHIESQLKECISKIIDTFKTHANNPQENRLFNLFELIWDEYKKPIPLVEIITNNYLIAPYQFYDENDHFLPIFNAVDENNTASVFEIDLMAFMLLHDLFHSVQPLTSNKKQNNNKKHNQHQEPLLKDKFPLGKNDLLLEKEYNAIELSGEFYSCTMKNKSGPEMAEVVMIVINTKLYFGSLGQKDMIIIKSKHSLSQMELLTDRSEPRMLSLFCFSTKDKFIEKNCLFKDIELAIRAKRNLEEHIKSAQYKEYNLFMEYFTNLSDKYSKV